MQEITVTPLEALAQLTAVASQIDTAECKDEGIYNRLQGAVQVAQTALAMAPKQEARQNLELLRKWAKDAANGKTDKIPYIDITNLINENIELRATFAASGGITAPAAANGALEYAEKASPIAITDSSALNGIKWYVLPPEHLRNGMQLYFVAPQPVAAAGPDAALIKALESALAIINNEADPDEYAAPLKLIRAALSGAKGN